METSGLAVNKLIVLSIIHRIPDITLNQLTTLSLETLYMDYFDFVTAYEELCRDRMVTESVRKNETKLDAAGRPVTRCDLTEQGHAILKTLEPRIPLNIRSYLAQACSGWQKDIRLKRTLSAEWRPDANGGFLVQLKQNDGLKDLIRLELTIPDKSMAQQICDRWKRSPGTVYISLLSILTGETAISSELPPEGFPHLDDEATQLSPGDLTSIPGWPEPDHRQQSLFTQDADAPDQ